MHINKRSTLQKCESTRKCYLKFKLGSINDSLLSIYINNLLWIFAKSVFDINYYKKLTFVYIIHTNNKIHKIPHTVHKHNKTI